MDKRTVSTFWMDQTDTHADILILLMHSFILIAHGLWPSLVVAGKIVTERTMVEDRHRKLIEHGNSQQRLLIVMPLIGGGGAKHDHKQAVYTELASFLTARGIKVHDVPKIADALVLNHGLPKMTSDQCRLLP